MTRKAADLADAIRNTLSDHGKPDDAIAMASYMKDKFPFYGVKSPIRKKATSEFWKNNKAVIKTMWPQLVSELWNSEARECQYAAMDILGKIEGQLERGDLEFIESLITRKSWWDTVDFLASHCIAQILKQDRALMKDKAQEYMDSGQLWLQRTSLIFQLSYKENTDWNLLCRLIDQTRGSKAFFINKGSGWALRQYSKVNPTAVSQYIASNKDWLSGLTVREGGKYV